MFWLKKFVSACLLPVPFGLLLITLSILLFALRAGRGIRRSALLLGWFILSLFSLQPVSGFLINHLQAQYQPLIHPPADATTIVVLGGGTSQKTNPPNLSLKSASLSRLTEGIRLYQQIFPTHPNAQLILSGGRVFQSQSDADTMRNTAVLFGINPKHITLEAGSHDTQDEANYLQKTLGQKPFILVTSAYHMPRAVNAFTRLGMHPIPAPTQYISDNDSFGFVPSAQHLAVSDIAIHEYLGMLWSEVV